MTSTATWLRGTRWRFEKQSKLMKPARVRARVRVRVRGEG